MGQRKSITEKVTWDGVVTGLGRRVRGEKKTWIVQTRVHDRTIKRVIGGRELSRPETREKAKVVLEELKVTVEVTPQALITVAEFGDRFHADKSPGWAETARKLHMRDLKTNIGPWLGEKRIGDVTRVDVISWLDDLTIAPGSKNRALAVLSRMMRHAEMLDLRPPGSNPCKGLRRRKIDFIHHIIEKFPFRIREVWTDNVLYWEDLAA